ncbi:MAG: dihydroorotase [Thermoproteota archaeon]
MSEVDLVITGGKVFFENALHDGGVAVQDGKIVAVGKDGKLPRGQERLNVGGRIICPGLIDSHVHLRDMGYSYKEDFRSGTLAAAAGGFTTILDMPNTLPVTDSLTTLSEKLDRAKSNIYVNVGFYLGLTRKTDFRALPSCIGLKAYLYSEREDLLVDIESILKAAKFLPKGYPLAVHAEKGSLINELRKRAVQRNLGVVEQFLYSHPSRAEVESVEEVVKMVPKETLLHLCHLSVPESVSAMSTSGRLVSAEVTAHHLLLSSQAVIQKGAIAITTPPAREPYQMKSMIEALKEGKIGIVASDHAPHSPEEKRSETPPTGIPGLETTLPLMLTLVNRGLINLSTLIMALSSTPARVFGLRGRGFIRVGGVADITIIDMKRTWTIDSSKFFSKAKYSPFDGLEVRGGAWATFVGGRQILQDGEPIVQPGTGRLLRRDQL